MADLYQALFLDQVLVQLPLIGVSPPPSSDDDDAQPKGIDNFTWAHMGMDLDFGIPGTCVPVESPVTPPRDAQGRSRGPMLVQGDGKPKWARRLPAMPRQNAGNKVAVDIMPRRGGASGYADWEVLLSLPEEGGIMDAVCGRGELEDRLSGVSA